MANIAQWLILMKYVIAHVKVPNKVCTDVIYYSRIYKDMINFREKPDGGVAVRKFGIKPK